MSVEIWEKFESRDGEVRLKGSSSELGYIVQGTDSDLEVYQTVLAQVPGKKLDPLSQLLLIRRSIRIKPIGAELWDATVLFVHPDEKDESQEPSKTGEEGDFTFDTTGGTEHQTVSGHGQWRGYARPGEQYPNYEGAINVTGVVGQHDVEGVDHPSPSLRFTRTKYQPESLVTAAYVKTLARVTGRKNQAPFWSFQAGEVLFEGASGSRRGRGDWEVQYHFNASENITDLQIGLISGISKLGFEYLWVRYAAVEDAQALAIVQQPQAVYVHSDVVKDGDFGLLQL